MRRTIVPCAAIALATIAATAPPWNWGTETGQFAHDPQFAASKALCRALGPPVIPAAERPSPAEAKALRGCDAEALYYGIGAKPDYAAARKCAIIEYDRAMADSLGEDDAQFSGSTILMAVYANGRGATANRNLATRLACAGGAAPAESDGRVRHLQALKPGETFDWCDDITSGMAEGVCAGHRATIADRQRQTRFSAAVARLPNPARALFPALQKAQAAFSEAQAGGETDQTGTARAAMTIDAGEANDTQFLTDLQRLAAGKWPAASHADALAADAALNKAYRAALVWAAGKDNFTTTKPNDIRDAQRGWLIYRDAWARLGAAAGMPTDAVLARITRLRLAQLQLLVAS